MKLGIRLALLTCLLGWPAHASAGVDLAQNFSIVVNDSVQESVLTGLEIKQIFLSNRTRWSNGEAIKLIIISPSIKESGDFFAEFLGIPVNQVKKFYLTKIFNGLIAEMPIEAETTRDVLSAVAATAGSIGYLPISTDAGKLKKIEIRK